MLRCIITATKALPLFYVFIVFFIKTHPKAHIFATISPF